MLIYFTGVIMIALNVGFYVLESVAMHSSHMLKRLWVPFQKTTILSKLYSSNVPLTTTRHPNMKRKDFAVLSDKDVAVFESIVGSSNVLRSDLDGYNTDWRKSAKGKKQSTLIYSE